MGVKNWKELVDLGLLEMMLRGMSALSTRGLALDAFGKLAAAIGEFIGTIMLERKLAPLC